MGGVAVGLACGGAAIGALGCGGNESLVLVAGQRVDATTIDRDPVSILPAGILVFGYLDATTMFQSNMGADVGALIGTLLPLGPESNFVPQRDVTKVFAGAYAMQGADFCAVIQGHFDPDAIRRAMLSGRLTIAGAPVVTSRYADNEVYTGGNLGFTLLTPGTVLTGNEIGIRRALDRLRNGPLKRAVPEWMTALARTPGATFAIAGDLSNQSPAGAAVQTMPFLAGAESLRVLGNFQPPGTNVVGTLSFETAESATNSADAIRRLNEIASFMGFLSALGLGISIPPIQVAQSEKDVGFAVAADESTSRRLLVKAGDALREAVRGQNK